MVGDWTVSGGTTGTVTYEWMDGGREIKGLEVIGNEQQGNVRSAGPPTRLERRRSSRCRAKPRGA
jgi:hypothetical protein